MEVRGQRSAAFGTPPANRNGRRRAGPIGDCGDLRQSPLTGAHHPFYPAPLPIPRRSPAFWVASPRTLMTIEPGGSPSHSSLPATRTSLAGLSSCTRPGRWTPGAGAEPSRGPNFTTWPAGLQDEGSASGLAVT
jgi:hypothetical protein